MARLGRILGIAAVAAIGIVWVAHAENQIWLKQTLEWSPAKSGDWSPLRFTAEQEEKFDEHRLYNSETLLLAGWRCCPWLSLGLGYRYVSERSGGEGPMKPEHRPTFDVNLQAPEFLTLKFDFRSRFEWRGKEGSTPYVRYRERLRLRTAWSVTDFRISPYVSEELFFSDKPDVERNDMLDRSRAAAGVTFAPLPANPELSCNLYCMVQHEISDGGSEWDPVNVFGFEIGWKF